MEQIVRIRYEGMGGAFNPPGDPEHICSVITYDKKGKEESLYSLRGALESEEIPTKIKEEIQKIFERNPARFTESWEHSCYNYFRNCYSPDGKDRNVSNCLVDNEGVSPAEHHLAYLHIKKFFPEYQPNLHLIQFNGPLGKWSNPKRNEESTL